MLQQQLCQKIVLRNQQLVQNKLLGGSKQRFDGRFGVRRHVLHLFGDFGLVFVEQRLRRYGKMREQRLYEKILRRNGVRDLVRFGIHGILRGCYGFRRCVCNMPCFRLPERIFHKHNILRHGLYA